MEENSSLPKTAGPQVQDGERKTLTCECLSCGRMHWKLANPPWAITHEDACRLSRIFNENAAPWPGSPAARINEWLKKLIATTKAADVAAEEQGFCGNPQKEPLSSPHPEDGEAVEAARKIIAAADRFNKCRAEFPIEKDRDFDACSEWENALHSACLEHGEIVARALLSKQEA